MGEHEELSNLLESSTEPEGVTVRSDDGRLFFLSKEDVERMTIPESRLYTAFRSLKDHEPWPAPANEPGIGWMVTVPILRTGGNSASPISKNVCETRVKSHARS